MLEVLRYYLRSRKGMTMSVRTVAIILLGIMTVVLIYAGVSGWITELGNGFVESVEYPTP